MESYGNNPNQDHNRQTDNHKNDAEKTSPIRKLQQRTTTIALTILVAVSFGVIGFEVLSANSKNAETNTKANGTKALAILAQEKELDQAGVATNLSETWGSQRTDAEAVKEINKIQAKKIKELKRQLNTANIKLHDIKAQLFTKGDPTDRARLAEVCQELVEKERYNEEFQRKIAELENERNLRNQKINRMEQTIDALASMTDTQRETKEKAIFNLQSQIERLEEDAKREREELQKTLAELEEANYDLQEAVADKLATIKNLEEEISWQYGLLQEKDKDLQSQSKLYALSEDHLQDEMNNLSEALEIEMLKNQSLTTELEVAISREKAQEQYTKSLENQLDMNKNLSDKEKDQWNREMVNLAKEYMELQGILDVYAHSHDHFSSKQTKLAALVREEKSKSEALREELEIALAAADSEQQKGLCIEEELHATAHKIHEMEDELKRKQDLIESKQQELDTLTYSNTSLRDQLYARIEQLTALLEDSQKEVRRKEATARDLTVNLELERARMQELDHKLQEAMTRNVEESDIIRELQEELHQKSERMIAMEERLSDKREEIDQLQDKILALSTEYEQEKSRSNELHTALSNSLNESESVYNSYTRLQNTVDENADMLTLLQDRMESKKRTIDDLQDKLDEISARLNYEQKKNREIEIALEDSKSQREAEKLRAKAFQDENEKVEQLIHSLKNEMANKDGRIEELRLQIESQENQVEALITQLEEERDHSNLLEDQVYETRMTKGFADSEIDGMESTINEQNQQIKKMQETIAKLSQKVELEQHRAMAYEKANKKELAHAKQLEEKLESFTTRIAELQNKVDEKGGRSVEKRSGSGHIATPPPSEKKKELAYNEEPSTPYIHQLDGNKKNQLNQKKQVADAGYQHTVREGENLGVISTYYYGSPNRWIDIYNANRKAIPDKNKLDPGTVLIIPR